MSEMKPTRPTLAAEVERFREVLDMLPDVKECHDAGRQFNAYDLDDEGERKAVCLGPIHSRPLSLIEAPGDVALLLEAALRVASSAMLAASPAPTTGREEIAAAFIAGAESVHEYWIASPGAASRGDPEFGEAASDYAASVAHPPAGEGWRPDRDEVAMVVCYWSEPSTCHDAYCSHACVAVKPGPWCWSAADAILALSPAPPAEEGEQ